jgi:hypothetical protein
MRFDPTLSREDTLDELTREAVAAWGEERAAELRSTLEATAGAVWTVAQVTLDPTDVEP